MNWQESLQLCTDEFSIIQLVLRIAKLLLYQGFGYQSKTLELIISCSRVLFHI